MTEKTRLDIQSHYRGALPRKPLCPSVPKMGTDGHSTYKLKWKPLFDGTARLDIQSHYRGALLGKPLCPSVPKMGTDGHCTYKLKWKPLFDGWVLAVQNI